MGEPVDLSESTVTRRQGIALEASDLEECGGGGAVSSASLRAVLSRYYDSTEGYCAVAVGRNGFVEASGRIGYESFRARYFLLPGELTVFEQYVIEHGRDHTVFFTPQLSAKKSRKSSRGCVDGRYLYADSDRLTPALHARVRQLLERGGFVVQSGGGPERRHVHVRLAELQPPAVIEALNRRLVRALDGDSSCSALNGLLRPPQTFNHKMAIRHGSVLSPVTWEECEGDGWSVPELEAVFDGYGVEDEVTEPVLARRDRVSPPPVDVGHTGQPPADLPPAIRAMLGESPGDRSVQTAGFVRACIDAGCSQEETVRAASAHRPSAEKYGRRLDKEISRLWAKFETGVLSTTGGDEVGQRLLDDMDRHSSAEHRKAVDAWLQNALRELPNGGSAATLRRLLEALARSATGAKKWELRESYRDLAEKAAVSVDTVSILADCLSPWVKVIKSTDSERSTWILNRQMRTNPTSYTDEEREENNEEDDNNDERSPAFSVQYDAWHGRPNHYYVWLTLDTSESLTPKALHERVRPRVDISTVRRILKALVELGLVEEVERGRWVRIEPPPGERHEDFHFHDERVKRFKEEQGLFHDPIAFLWGSAEDQGSAA